MHQPTITAPIIPAMSALGYSPNKGGVCYGIAMMAIQAQVRGNFATFLNRMRFIGGFDFDTAAGKSQFQNAVDDPENAHFYVKPFFDELSVYFGPFAMGDFAQEAGLYAEQGPTLAGLNLEGDTDKPYLSSVPYIMQNPNPEEISEALIAYFAEHESETAFRISIPGVHSMSVIHAGDQWYFIDHNSTTTFTSQADCVNALASQISRLQQSGKTQGPPLIESYCGHQQYRAQFDQVPSSSSLQKTFPEYPQWITQGMYTAVKNREFQVLEDLITKTMKRYGENPVDLHQGCLQLMGDVSHLDDVQILYELFDKCGVKVDMSQATLSRRSLGRLSREFSAKTASAGPDPLRLEVGLKGAPIGADLLLRAARFEKKAPFIQEMLFKTLKISVDASDSEGITALHIAAAKGHVDVIQMLIAHHANIESVDSQGLTALHYAVVRGNIEVTQVLMGCIDEKEFDVFRALNLAIAQGHAEIIKMLINDSGFNFDQFKYPTALIIAAQSGHIEATKALMNDCGIDSQQLKPEMAIDLAARTRNVKMFEVLVSAGVDLNTTNSDTGRTALHYLAEAGNSLAVRFLVERGVDVAVQDSDNQTALHYAAYQGHVDVVRLLVDCGVNVAVDEQDSNNQRALHLSVEQGHVDVVRELVKAGGVLNAEMAQSLQEKSPDAFKVFLREQRPHRLGLKVAFGVVVTCAAWGVFAASSLSLVANMTMMPVWIPILISIVACSSIVMSWSNRDRLFREIKSGNVHQTDNILQKYSQPKALQLIQGLLVLSMVALCMMAPFTLMSMVVPSAVMAIAISSVAALCTVGAACAVYLKDSVSTHMRIGDDVPNIAPTTSGGLASDSNSGMGAARDSGTALDHQADTEESPRPG